MKASKAQCNQRLAQEIVTEIPQKKARILKSLHMMNLSKEIHQ